MKLTRAGDSREIDAEVISRDQNSIRVRIGDREIAAEFTPNADGGGILTIGGRRYPVFGARQKESILISVGPASFEFRPAEAALSRPDTGPSKAEVAAHNTSLAIDSQSVCTDAGVGMVWLTA